VIVKDTIMSKGSSPAANCAQNALSPGTVISDGYNLYDDAADSCGLTGVGDLHAANPELGPLANNGGGLQTEALLVLSVRPDRCLWCDHTRTATGATNDRAGERRPIQAGTRDLPLSAGGGRS
jgi:hypothetical protein